jgi:hypothetical protein
MAYWDSISYVRVVAATQKIDIKIDEALTLLTPTILAAYVSGPSTCDGTAILSSIVAQTIPKA